MRFIFVLILYVSFLVPLNEGRAAQDDPRLKELFVRLETAGNETAARQIENTIWAIWLENKNAPVNHILGIGIQAMNAGALELALRSFTEVVEMAPNFAEGWNKRATVHYLMSNFDASVKDIAHTLNLEPRHFGALSGLGLINLALGRHAAALKAFEQAKAVYPRMHGVDQRIKELKEILRGEET